MPPPAREQSSNGCPVHHRRRHHLHDAFLDKEPFHTPVLSGHAWEQELVNGYPDGIKDALGMRKDEQLRIRMLGNVRSSALPYARRCISSSLAVPKRLLASEWEHKARVDARPAFLILLRRGPATSLEGERKARQEQRKANAKHQADSRLLLALPRVDYIKLARVNLQKELREGGDVRRGPLTAQILRSPPLLLYVLTMLQQAPPGRMEAQF
ncbi:hypothetical protein BDR07DRAFT_1496308 [Suillus spraguei]|nr:hypothetical protein BDR07DRAFT_1496308 [Suillus spraguei]